MSGVDRTQILRRDCPSCQGKGYVVGSTGEAPCEACQGVGLLEKEVPYKFDTLGKRTQEEEAAEWGIPVEELKDAGHAEQEAPRRVSNEE
jgi:RecJ-like exonuclease